MRESLGNVVYRSCVGFKSLGMDVSTGKHLLVLLDETLS